jgi:hypothetical protein
LLVAAWHCPSTHGAGGAALALVAVARPAPIPAVSAAPTKALPAARLTIVDFAGTTLRCLADVFAEIIYRFPLMEIE